MQAPRRRGAGRRASAAHHQLHCRCIHCARTRRTWQDAAAAGNTHPLQVVQWTMAARPGHPLLCGMRAAIRAQLRQEAGHAAAPSHGVRLQLSHQQQQYQLLLQQHHSDDDHAVLERTGPGVWSRAVHAYLGAAVAAAASGSTPPGAAVAAAGGAGVSYGSTPPPWQVLAARLLLLLAGAAGTAAGAFAPFAMN